MTKQHQLERQYTFTPEEFHYLQTTQRLALERMQSLLTGTGKLDEADSKVHSDLYLFGFDVRDAIKDEKTTIPIKMGVIYWLNSIWNPLYDQTAQQPVFAADDTPSTRADIHEMRQTLLRDYIDYANHGVEAT